MGDRRRAGGALIFCVLLVLALGLLAHGALLMSREELAVSRAGMHLLRARAAADAGMSAAVMAEAPSLPDSLPEAWRVSLTSGSEEGARFRVRASRLSRELWLVEADGADGPGPWVDREARVVWSLDPVARVGAFRGVVEVGSGAPASGVSQVTASDVFHSHPDLDVTRCLPWGHALDSLAVVNGGTLPPLSTLPDGADTLRVQPSLGLFSGDELASLAKTAVRGEGTPTPSIADGVCLDTDPWNWGDPEDDSSPCRDYMPLVATPEPLTVDGGVGQGVLVVLGDLTIKSGGTFDGLVLVRGSLTLEEGASVVGLARALGGIHVASDASLVGSGCWAVRALSSVRSALARPRPVEGWNHLGPLPPSPGGEP